MPRFLRVPAALLFLLLASSLPALAGGWNPPGWEKVPPREEPARLDPLSQFLLGGLALYRGRVGEINGSTCPSRPSCSAFAVEAVKTEGPLLGSLLTVARLVGEGDEGAFAGRIFADGRWRYYDPVSRAKGYLFSETKGNAP